MAYRGIETKEIKETRIPPPPSLEQLKMMASGRIREIRGIGETKLPLIPLTPFAEPTPSRGINIKAPTPPSMEELKRRSRTFDTWMPYKRWCDQINSLPKEEKKQRCEAHRDVCDYSEEKGCWTRFPRPQYATCDEVRRDLWGLNLVQTPPGLPLMEVFPNEENAKLFSDYVKLRKGKVIAVGPSSYIIPGIEGLWSVQYNDCESDY